MDSEGFVLLAAVSSLAILTTFSGLVWAAIQDGHDARSFRDRPRA